MAATAADTGKSQMLPVVYDELLRCTFSLSTAYDNMYRCACVSRCREHWEEMSLKKSSFRINDLLKVITPTILERANLKHDKLQKTQPDRAAALDVPVCM